MTGFVIKELPAGLHRKLKRRAAQHRRSMTKEVLAMLERAVGEEARPEVAPAPFKGRIALTDRLIARARRQGRA